MGARAMGCLLFAWDGAVKAEGGGGRVRGLDERYGLKSPGPSYWCVLTPSSSPPGVLGEAGTRHSGVGKGGTWPLGSFFFFWPLGSLASLAGML